MFSSIQRRLIKETLIHVYRKQPSLVNLPVWFLPFDDKPDDVLVETVRALQDFVPLPWPDDNCIILAEEPWSKIITSTDVKMMLAFIHLKKNDEQWVEGLSRIHGEDEQNGTCGGHDIHMVTTFLHDGKMHQLNGQIILENISVPVHMAMSAAKESCDNRANAIIKQLHVTEHAEQIKI